MTTRPVRQQIVHGQSGWQDAVNTNFEQIYNSPFPVVQYANVGDLPPAAAHTTCLATVGTTLYISDGISWNTLATASGVLTELASQDMTGQSLVQIPYQPAWDVYSRLYIVMRDYILTVTGRAGIGFRQIPSQTLIEEQVVIRQAGFDQSRYLGPTYNNTYSSGAVNTGPFSSFGISVDNTAKVNKGVEMEENGAWDTASATAAVPSRGNCAVYTDTFANGTTDGAFAPILETFEDIGGLPTPVGFSKIEAKGASNFLRGTLAVYGM